ncbi:ATP-dependent protease ATPase subunit HslU [Candidatus Gromoviella agglomerans]|uniref:ATP-dependent protease ATPase subunit HslU n=1 Tax=Candidatus Gromoviella agglomerans TaxID=2806609 RepID=UPI001E467A9D|nr:ATP-dependent protease ATPase subunit HslU [Candidatus Gromoviella agglomerans]UFX98196.1 ATP-dependent protease ATPase subunit HslU [Candidatus Gromoviella agglomerans]
MNTDGEFEIFYYVKPLAPNVILNINLDETCKSSGFAQSFVNIHSYNDEDEFVERDFYTNSKSHSGRFDSFSTLNARDIVHNLDKHIVGQDEAKKVMAIAFKNRERRLKTNSDIRDEISPSNVLMIGPTGVGKTEIGKRLANLANAPFIKVDATKFTEVGYVGKDVEQIIKDLIDISVTNEKEYQKKFVASRVIDIVNEQIVSILVSSSASDITRDRFLQKIKNEEMEETEIEIDVPDNKNQNSMDFSTNPINMISINDLLNKTFSSGTKKKKVTISQAKKILFASEMEKYLDNADMKEMALKNVEERGIVFIDEIDKICSTNENAKTDISREGVQRDLLPLLSGTTVYTKYGAVSTNHILFIASGAFHSAKVSDLLPELQGRLHVRVNVNPLSKKDFISILTKTEYNLISQYKSLLRTDDVELEFTDAAIETIAECAFHMNEIIENIGARRLKNVMEQVLQDISFEAPYESKRHIMIDDTYVKIRMEKQMKNNTNFQHYIL